MVAREEQIYSYNKQAKYLLGGCSTFFFEIIWSTEQSFSMHDFSEMRKLQNDRAINKTTEQEN